MGEKMEVDSNNKFKIVLSEAAPSDGTILCKLSPEISAVDMEIRWFKETDCVCFYKNERLIEGVGYEGARLPKEELERGNVSLQLKKLDAGDYLCQITSEDRTEEITIAVTHEDQTELPQKNRKEKIDREWTDKERIKMANSALLAVFYNLEKRDAQKRDHQNINAAELQTEKQTQTEEIDMQQEELSKRMSDNMRLPVKTMTERVKVFSILAGKTNNCDKKLIAILGNRIENLKEVGSVDEGNIILIFCPIVSQTGTDIEAALNKFNHSTDSKLVVLVVLHHTFDPEKTVPDSSRCVKRTDILTVDLLFYEDTGLLKCQKNSDAIDKAVNWLKDQGWKAGVEISLRQNSSRCVNRTDIRTDLIQNQYQARESSHESNKHEVESQQVVKKKQKTENYSSTKWVKVFSILAGKTNNCDKKLIASLGKRIENLREVGSVDEGNIILIFCPIVSRTGTDIEAALNKFNHSTDSKLVVLVVLHHTFDPEKTVPDSSRCVKRTDILTVDCLFNEETGLLKCQKNSDAINKAVNWLKDQGWKAGVEISLRQKGVKVFSISAGKTNNCDKKCIASLGNRIENLKEVGSVDEGNIILIFCPIVSQTGTDIEAALNKFSHSTDSKLVVLVVLHHTFDPEKTVPDSSRCVKRTDILTVDCLFNEETGLLKCQKNSDAIDKAVNWLKDQGWKAGVEISLRQNSSRCVNRTDIRTDLIQNQYQARESSHESNKHEVESQQVAKKKQKTENYSSTKRVNVFSILSGKTNNCDKKLIAILGKRIENLKEVGSVDEGNIILIFCPIVSQTGTDIEAALNKFNHSDSKLVVLVVLHHTFDPEKTVPDSSRCVKRTDILTVDLLFYEDTGLLECQKNSDAIDKAVNWLIVQGREMGIPVSPLQNQRGNSGFFSSWFSR